MNSIVNECNCYQICYGSSNTLQGIEICDMQVSISNFDQILGKRECQTLQVFNFAILLFLKLFAGTKFCENGQKLQRMTKFNTFKVY